MNESRSRHAFSLVVAAASTIGAIFGGSAAMRQVDRGTDPPPKTTATASTFQSIGLLDKRPAVITAIHPRCNCSRRTIDALIELVDRRGDEFNLTLLVFRPSDRPKEWSTFHRRDQLIDRPNVTLIDDVDGDGARSTGLIVSGATSFVRLDGSIPFSGSLFPSSNESVDSRVGLFALERELDRLPNDVHKTPFLGCPIVETNKGKQ